MFALINATVVNLGAEIMLKLMEIAEPIFKFCLLYGFLQLMFNNWLKMIFTVSVKSVPY